MKIKFFFFIMMITADIPEFDDYPVPPDQRHPSEPICNMQLVKQFEFEGLEYPEQMSLGMCPLISNSCCTLEDQNNMYEFWIVNNKEKEILDRFQYYKDVYRHLFDNGRATNELVQEIMQYLHEKKISNCKLLGKQILLFDLEKIYGKLLESMDQMYEFFYFSYKGFYCTICDSDSQQFISFEEKKIYLKRSYCREIIQNTFQLSLYLHKNLMHYLNLITRFMSSCDHKGIFEEQYLDPKYRFQVDEDDSEVLDQCKVFINEMNWFDYCEPICQNFHPLKLNKFFYPKVKKFYELNIYLDEKIENLQKNLAKTQAKEQAQQSTRILEVQNQETKITTDTSTNDQNKDQENDNQENQTLDQEFQDLEKDNISSLMEKQFLLEEIYASPINTDIKLEDFEIIYQDLDYGIDPYTNGKSTDISEQKQVNDMLLNQVDQKQDNVVENKSTWGKILGFFNFE